MNNKEEKAREYRLKANLNAERYLEGGSNIERAYIAGWDAGVEWHKEQELQEKIEKCNEKIRECVNEMQSHSISTIANLSIYTDKRKSNYD